MWNKTQIAAFERALAAMGKACPECEALSQLSEHSPQFKDRVAELQSRAENCKCLSELALKISRNGSG